MCLIVQIFNYDGLNEWLSVHNAVALPYWAVYFWLIVCCLWVNCGLISKTPFFPELQNQSHSMSLYSWSNSKWADYGWNHFLHPVCLITFYFSFYCTTWLATTNSTKLIIPGMHMAFSLYVCKYVQTVDLKKSIMKAWRKLSNGGKTWGSGGVKLPANGLSLSQLWELQLSGGAETNRGGSCGDHAVQTTAHIFPLTHYLATTN